MAIRDAEVTFTNCNIYQNTARNVSTLTLPLRFLHRPHGRKSSETDRFQWFLQGGAVRIGGGATATFDNCNIHGNAATRVEIDLPQLSIAPMEEASLTSLSACVQYVSASLFPFPDISSIAPMEENTLTFLLLAGWWCLCRLGYSHFH